MRTDDLILALQADSATRRWPQARVWWVALAVALLAAGLAFAVMLRPRPDMAAAMETSRVLFKFVFGVAVAAAAFVALRPMSRPESDRRPLRWMLLPALLLLAAVIAEVALTPPAEWRTHMMGVYPMDCVLLIPTIALLPLAIALWTLRHGAPRHPALAGAVAGILSGGLAVIFYAMHCRDDSPFFVAAWYSAGIGLTALLGAVGGRLFARW